MSRIAWLLITLFGPMTAMATALQPSETILEASLRVREWTATEAAALLNRTDCLPTKFGIEVVRKKTQDDYRSSGVGQQGTMVAFWETDQVSCLRRFGIVQWIRGCVFSSRFTNDGGVRYTSGISRSYRGQFTEFNHPEWMVDSDVEDPLYNAPEPDQHLTDRLGLARWVTPGLGRADRRAEILNDVLRMGDSSTYHFLSQGRPRLPQVYVSDHPTSAHVTPRAATRGTPPPEQHATQSVLEFETCLYPIESVPLQGDPARPETALTQGGPLHCWTWSSKSVFDHLTQEFKPDASVQDCQLVPWRSGRER